MMLRGDDMKTLLLALAITSGAFAMTTDNREMECNMIITMFYYSIEEERPITDAQLSDGIDACKHIEEHQEFVAEMKYMLHNTTEI